MADIGDAPLIGPFFKLLGNKLDKALLGGTKEEREDERQVKLRQRLMEVQRAENEQQRAKDEVQEGEKWKTLDHSTKGAVSAFLKTNGMDINIGNLEPSLASKVMQNFNLQNKARQEQAAAENAARNSLLGMQTAKLKQEMGQSRKLFPTTLRNRQLANVGLNISNVGNAVDTALNLNAFTDDPQALAKRRGLENILREAEAVKAGAQIPTSVPFTQTIETQPEDEVVTLIEQMKDKEGKPYATKERQEILRKRVATPQVTTPAAKNPYIPQTKEAQNAATQAIKGIMYGESGLTSGWTAEGMENKKQKRNKKTQ